MSQTQKTPVQIQLDALNRKRKPLINLTAKTESEALKAKDDEILLLTGQLRKLQEAVSGKESYITELEDKLAAALNPKPHIETPKTEEVPGSPSRRPRRGQEPKPEEESKVKEEPLQADKPKEPAAKPVLPGDGIEEGDE